MMKSGTTTLFRWLSAHPDIIPCNLKEPHFFSLRWHRGWNWYLSLFPETDRDKRTFEASQSYCHPDLTDDVARRIRSSLPTVRLVFVLRHPVARARSEYRHQVQRGREARPFTEAISDSTTPYLRRSMYWSCLEPFLESFSRDRLIFLRFEDLVSPGEREWNRLLSALDLSWMERPRVQVRSTQNGGAWRRATGALVKLGAGRAAQRLPGRAKKVLRPLFLDESDAHRERLASANAQVPRDLVQGMWEDVARMERWLGVGKWWKRR